MKKTLKEIAEMIGGVCTDAPELEIHALSDIDHAGPNHLTFAVPPHLEKAEASNAGAVIIGMDVETFAKPAIRVANPRAAFAQLLAAFSPRAEVKRGIHPTAVIGENVKLGENVAIMAYAVLDDNVTVGDNTVIYPHTYVGVGAQIGADTILYPNVTIYEGCRVGNRNIIHSSTVIGGDGFGFATKDGVHHKVPQIGNVILEDDVEIGAHVGIDRAAMNSTIVGKGTKIDNLVHLGHNVVLGEGCLVVAQTGISGSTIVGHHVTFGGQCGTVGHINIGSNSVLAARSGLIADVPEKSFYAGFPAGPHVNWLRQEASARKVPDLIKQVKKLEKRLAELESKS